MSFQYFECEYVLVREVQLLDFANPKQAVRQAPVLKIALANMILANLRGHKVT